MADISTLVSSVLVQMQLFKPKLQCHHAQFKEKMLSPSDASKHVKLIPSFSNCTVKNFCNLTDVALSFFAVTLSITRSDLTLGWMCWDVNSWEDWGIVLLHTWMLQTCKLSNRLLLQRWSHLSYTCSYPVLLYVYTAIWNTNQVHTATYWTEETSRTKKLYLASRQELQSDIL